MSRLTRVLVAVLTLSMFPLSIATAQFPFGGGGPGGRGRGPGGGGPGGFLGRFDANENGIIEPDEVPERARGFFDRMVERAGMDPSKPIAISDMEKTFQRMREERGGDDSERRGRRGRRDDEGDERERREEAREEPAESNRPRGRGFGPNQPTSESGAAPSTSATKPAEQAANSAANQERFRNAATQIFRRYDRNKDGILQEDERSRYRWANLKEADTNGDNLVNDEELVGYFARKAGAKASGQSSTPKASASPKQAFKPATSARVAGSVGKSGRKSYRFLTPQERLPEGLPAWFGEKDANADGQVMMAEWTSAWTEELAIAFVTMDKNRDGTITAKEALAAN